MQLQSGQVIKNYKALCDILDVIPASGKRNKEFQVREFKRYFDYHTDGHKIIIDEVFEKPRDKIDGRANNKGGNNKKYGEILDNIILNILKNNNHLEVSKTVLFKDYINLFGADYYKVLRRQEKYINKYGINEYLLKKYLAYTYDITKECLKTTLQRLNKKGIISYEQKLFLKDQLDGFYAVEIQKKQINDISEDVYKQLEITPFSRSIPEKNKQFIKEVCNEFNKTGTDIFNFWNVYFLELIDNNITTTDNQTNELRIRISNSVKEKIKNITYINDGQEVKPFSYPKYDEQFNIMDKLIFGLSAREYKTLPF